MAKRPPAAERGCGNVAKKKKVRVALKKNRSKRTRANDLTRRYHADELGKSEPLSGERVRAKGELSRHRTIMTDVPAEGGAELPPPGTDDPAANRSVDLTNCLLGRVLRIHGLLSIVELEGEEGKTYTCHVRGLLKTLSIDARNVVTVGDRVWFRPGVGETDEGLIEKVEPRQGTIARGYRRHKHVLVANVDQILIVSALEEPGLKLSLIDRYLISAEIGGVRPVIVLNKADLVDPALYQWVVGLYTLLGYETIVTSAATGQGIDRLRALVVSGTTAFSGQSGVGKSSLLNAIQPGLNLRIRAVSDWTFKGKHTTTTADLIRLETGGFVVDTPGLRQFELWGVVPADLSGHFPEFRPYMRLCKFPDCSHTHETECAVKDAVHWDQIHPGRFESYLKLYDQQPLDGE
ncbi:MAG: ribosome small subunit-dependent GTPase A [Isosphaeraceae bacterium]